MKKSKKRKKKRQSDKEIVVLELDGKAIAKIIAPTIYGNAQVEKY